jgi:hypothetical protein
MLVRKKWALSHILVFRSEQDVTIRCTPFRSDKNSFVMDGQQVAFVTLINFSCQTGVLLLLSQRGLTVIAPITQEVGGLNTDANVGICHERSHKGSYVTKSEV